MEFDRKHAWQTRMGRGVATLRQGLQRRARGAALVCKIIGRGAALVCKIIGRGAALVLTKNPDPAPHYFASLRQFEQHFQYFTVFLWKKTHVKPYYLMYTEMW